MLSTMYSVGVQLIKLTIVLSMIKRTITYKDLKIMLNLCKTLVRRHLEYSVVRGAPHYKKDNKWSK